MRWLLLAPLLGVIIGFGLAIGAATATKVLAARVVIAGSATASVIVYPAEAYLRLSDPVARSDP